MGMLDEYVREYMIRIEQLEEALKFYANQEHIGPAPETVREGEQIQPGFDLIDTGYIENGARARKALGG